MPDPLHHADAIRLSIPTPLVCLHCRGTIVQGVSVKGRPKNIAWCSVCGKELPAALFTPTTPSYLKDLLPRPTPSKKRTKL